MSIAAIIQIGEFNDSPKNAIYSVWQSRDRFDEVHFICPNYEEESEFYDGHRVDEQKLRDHGIAVFYESEIDIKTIKTSYVAEIPCHCIVKKSGIDNLQKKIKSSEPMEQIFSLNAVVYLKTTTWRHGFLFVTALWMMFWNIWERGKTIKCTDVRVRAVMQKGKHRYLAHSMFSWIWNSNSNTAVKIEPAVRSTCVLAPDDINYVSWYLRTNKYFKFKSFWWIIFMGFYWIFFLYTTLELIRLATLYLGLETFADISFFWLPNVLIIPLWILNWVVTIYACLRTHSFPHLIVMSAFLNFYIILFPFVLMYERCRVLPFVYKRT